jgi:hypothetical protein
VTPSPTPPRDLRDAIARDLKPARPLAAPAIRALALVPLALGIVVAVPVMQFFRSDMTAIGFVRAWGFSIAQALAGVAIVAAALRESIPGRALSRAAVVWMVAGGLAIPATLLLSTAASFDLGPDRGRGLAEGAMCFRTAATAAIPPLVFVAVLIARAFPLRPSVAGALYGLGCGLIADAGLRLYCEYTALSHVVFGHGGAILGAMLVGVVVTWISAPRSGRK